MSHHRRSQARRQRAIERRRQADAERRREAIEQGNKLLKPTDEFAWKPWYADSPADTANTIEQEEREIEVKSWREAVNSRTQYMRVIDVVSETSFAEYSGQVTR